MVLQGTDALSRGLRIGARILESVPRLMRELLQPATVTPRVWQMTMAYRAMRVGPRPEPTWQDSLGRFEPGQ